MSLSELLHSKNYVESMEKLVKAISSNVPDVRTLFGDAATFFAERETEVGRIKQAEQHLAELEEKLQNEEERNKDAGYGRAKSNLSTLLTKQKEKRLERLDGAMQVCQQIIELSEGNDYEETQVKSAKYLGCLLLSSSGQGKRLAELHQSIKPAYKAVLSVRLLDKLVSENLIKDNYITQHYVEEVRYERDNPHYPAYYSAVIFPTLLTAIYQGVGMQHPEVVEILYGDGDKDPYRLLEPEERQKMLQLNFQYTLLYLSEGLGCANYVGNFKEERDEFNEAEVERVKFQSILIKDAVKSKIGVGEVIKIPQIYVSVLFSTKRQYIKKELPKASLLIEQMAKADRLKEHISKAFIDIVGYFPQGYGITFIPVNMRGMEVDGYEYGIVCRLNPEKPHVPFCRQVTRNLGYISSGQVLKIEKANNLHYKEARVKLKKIPNDKLLEIMKKLSHDFNPDNVEEMLPSFWEPHDYFSIKKNQNLWNRAV